MTTIDISNSSLNATMSATVVTLDCTALALSRLPAVHPVVATTRFVIQSIFTPIVLVFGLVTNAINIVVLTRREMRSSTNAYLTTVAVCDIGYLLFAFLQGLKNMAPVLYASDVYMALHAYMGPFCSLFSNVSVWIICSFTVERFIAVRWPMKGIMWCTLQNAKRAIFIVASVATLLTSNEFFVWPQSSRVNGTNCTIWKPRPRTLAALDALKADMHYNWIMPILFQFIPFILLLVLNGFLIKSVVTAQKQRAKLTGNGSNGAGAGAGTGDVGKVALVSHAKSTNKCEAAGGRRRSGVAESTPKSESKTTVLLIAVVLLFLVCHLPSAFVLLHNDYQNRKYAQPLPEDEMVRRLVIGNASNALVQLNSATNFILYSFLSRKFVTVFKRLLRQSLALPCLAQNKTTNRTSATDVQDSRALLTSPSGNSSKPTIETSRSTASGKTNTTSISMTAPSGAEFAHSTEMANNAATSSFSSRNGA